MLSELGPGTRHKTTLFKPWTDLLTISSQQLIWPLLWRSIARLPTLLYFDIHNVNYSQHNWSHKSMFYAYLCIQVEEDLNWLYDNNVAYTKVFHDGSTAKVLWRYSGLQPTWRSGWITSVDYSTRFWHFVKSSKKFFCNSLFKNQFRCKHYRLARTWLDNGSRLCAKVSAGKLLPELQ